MKRLKGKFYLFCAFTFAGTSVISAQLISDQLGVFTITAVSLFWALLILLPLCRKKLKQTVLAMSKGDWLRTGLQALFGIFLFRMFFLQGLNYTSAGEAGILTGAIPAITAILAIVVLKERVSAKKIIGITSTVFGILLIQGLLTNSFSSEHFLGNMLVLCAAASESIFSIISRITTVKSKRRQSFDPVVQTTFVCLIALIFSLIPALFEHPVHALSGATLTDWLALLWYGCFVTALAFIFWYAGIKRCPAYTAAAFSGMMPFTALFLSVLVLGETIAWPQWAGAALVILGMVLIGISQKKAVPKLKEAKAQN